MGYYEQLKAAIDRLDDLHDQALLEQMHSIVQLAKQNDDGNTTAEFAHHLLQAGSHLGRFDYEMIGFAELKSLYERDAAFADLRSQVLWYYKWLAERLPEYVEVPRQRIEAFMDDMEAFYLKEKEGLRPVWEHRCRIASFMGLNDLSQQFMERWQSTEKHGSDDCPACETHSLVQQLLDLGQIEEAIKAAEPIINGEQSCEEVPATTFSRLLIPMLFTQNPEQAFGMSMFVRRYLRHTPKLLSHLCDHVILNSLLGVWPNARRTMFITLSRVTAANNSFHQFCVWRSAWLCTARMKKAGIEDIHFPPRTELANMIMTTADATALFRQRSIELADAFDARNATDRFAKRIESIEKLAEL